jgi:hypothetical protein
MDPKSELHSSCLRPWPFKDAQLESSFLSFAASTVLDRTKVANQIIVCGLLVQRLVLFYIRSFFPFSWTTKEILLYMIRFAVIGVASICTFINWKKESTKMLSSCLIYSVRVTFLAACFEQLGVDQPDSSIQHFPIMFAIGAGVNLPSFLEFASYTGLVFLIKPALSIIRLASGSPRSDESCSNADLQTLAVQNGCLLCIAIATFYPLFSDTRRHWLLSFEVFGPLNRVNGVSDANLTSSIQRKSEDHREGVEMQQQPGDGEAPVALDLEHDDYFPAEQRAEQLQTWRAERDDIALRTEALRNGQAAPRWRRLPGSGGMRLRRGGRRRISLAADEDSGERLVAKGLPGGAAQAAFLRREVLRARALAHPGLVAVRGGGQEGGGLYVLSEYCEGGRCA